MQALWIVKGFDVTEHAEAGLFEILEVFVARPFAGWPKLVANFGLKEAFFARLNCDAGPRGTSSACPLEARCA
jgi:hypothetical protein